MTMFPALALAQTWRLKKILLDSQLSFLKIKLKFIQIHQNIMHPTLHVIIRDNKVCLYFHCFVIKNFAAVLGFNPVPDYNLGKLNLIRNWKSNKFCFNEQLTNKINSL